VRQRTTGRRAASVLSVAAAAILALAGGSHAESVCQRWGTRGARCAHPATVTLKRSGNAATVEVDLSALPRGAKVRRADLIVRRTSEVTGREDDALMDIAIRPVGKGRQPLELRPPWYDRLDATGAVREAAGSGLRLVVEACPRWDANATALDVAYEAAPQDVPPQVRGLDVVHRAGQTFLVFDEIDDRSADPTPTWDELRRRLDRMDEEHQVRYRVYRHGKPITAKNVAAAERLGEVRPMSAYNARGRSVDELIALHRRRAIDDLGLAKRLARGDYFSRYTPDMPEMAELRIGRFAVEDDKPLPPHAGLYVHHPTKAGKAFYAVVTVVDGTANLRDFSPANATARPVAETVGPGVPVRQGPADVTVFFDYPGVRYRYVQWAAPPVAHLPNQYFNWGVFVPRDLPAATVRRVRLFFHGDRQRYLKPPWPHRRDTVILSPHDAPYRSYGYGWHESLGTLRSMRQGKVRPFFARRVDAMLAWALAAFSADPARVSVGGRGSWGGTAAAQYAIRRPGEVAYAAFDAPDPDPKQTPYEYSHYGRGDKRKTSRPEMDAVWGKAEWRLPAETDRPIWEEMDLPAAVRRTGDATALPYFTLGAGSLHQTWKQETDLMKAYVETHNAFMAVFFWGGKPHLPLPVGAETGDWPFEPRSDAPLLACRAKQYHPNPKFFDAQFVTGKRGYGAGSRLNTRPRWDPEDVVDRPDRLEMTIYAARRVTYAGRLTCDVTVRNAQRFRPKPGERLSWTLTDRKTNKQRQSGEATVDKHGRIVLTDVEFSQPARLVIRREAKAVSWQRRPSFHGPIPEPGGRLSLATGASPWWGVVENQSPRRGRLKPCHHPQASLAPSRGCENRGARNRGRTPPAMSFRPFGAANLLPAMVFASTGPEHFVTTTFGNDARREHRGTATLERDVLRFDVSSLKGAKVLRAMLRVPTAGHGTGQEVQVVPVGLPNAKALALRPPEYRSFDATAAARAWAADASANKGLRIEAAGGVTFDRAVLEVSFLGKAGRETPPPTGLRAIHQSGQTFLVWREPQLEEAGKLLDPFADGPVTFAELDNAVRRLVARRRAVYRVYRHDKPITRATLGEAELLREVPAIVSGWNLLAVRNTEHPNQGTPTRRSPLRPGRNLAVGHAMTRYRITPGGEPLGRNQALAVITTRSGRSYYAVTTAIDGREAVAQLGDASLARPVKEDASLFPATIYQRTNGGDPKNHHCAVDVYASWLGPSLHNLPAVSETFVVRWGDLPAKPDAGLPLMISTGTHGGSATEMANPGWHGARRHVPGAVYVGVTEGGMWQGFHECIGTLRGYGQGVVHEYPQRRVLAATWWATGNAKLDIDPRRVSIWGQMAHWALRWGQIYSVVMSNGYGNLTIGKEAQKHGWKWGPYPKGSKNAAGADQWEHMNLAKWVRENPTVELPYWLCWPAYGAYPSHSIGDFGFMPWPEMLHAMASTKRAFAANWSTNGPGPIGPLRELVPRIRRDRSLPAFGNCSLDHSPGDGDHDDAEKGGGINLWQLWEPETVVDWAKRWEVTVRLRPDCPYESCTTDITPRRCQAFRATPGEEFTWTHTAADGGKMLQSGKAKADPWGLVTIEKLKLTKQASRVRLLWSRKEKAE